VRFCPAARVVHHWGASSRKRSAWALRQLVIGKRLYFRKHHGPGAERQLRIGLGAGAVARAVISSALALVDRRRASALLAQQRVVLGALMEPLR